MKASWLIEAVVCQLSTVDQLGQSPHAIHRGYIPHELNAGVERAYVSGRCNVSEEVIEQHYDRRNEQERMQVRHRALTEAHRSQGIYGGEK